MGEGYIEVIMSCGNWRGGRVAPDLALPRGGWHMQIKSARDSSHPHLYLVCLSQEGSLPQGDVCVFFF